MTVHKLTAGDGYTYLTRQVASADQVRAPGQDLADYYLTTGTPPGAWTGSGAADLGMTGPVSEAQMRALFGEGLHPDAERILADHAATGRPRAEALGAARLGRRFASYTAGTKRHPVAGYDLVFSPVKSVSLLWALGDSATRAAVQAAHHDAVADTLAWLEANAAFSRIGKDGVTRVPVRGLICAAFDHRDSRAGDPDLHTHVAVSNKVRAVDDRPGGVPRWLTLDGKALFHAGVAASERYNTRLEDGMRRRLGVQFVERPDTVGRSKRPVREIEGVPDELIRGFSRRRRAIEDRYAQLESEYRSTHGRSPDNPTQLKLAQRATLDTRQGKPAPVTFGEQLADWRRRAETMIGASAVDELEAGTTGRPIAWEQPRARQVDDAARAVIAVLESQRATWTHWHIVAEAERQTRSTSLATREERDDLVASITRRAEGAALSIRIEPTEGTRFTTTRILGAEQRLLNAAARPAGEPVDAVAARRVIADFEHRQARSLDPGQAALVESFTTNPNQIVAGIGPAGSGKTTAMRAACAIWDRAGTRVIPLATSARSAQVLSQELDRRAENLHKYVHQLDNSTTDDDEFFRLRKGDVVLVDEAGMAGTLRLERLLIEATVIGATIRLLGDPYQLGAVEAGGALRLIANEVGAVELTHLHRFADPAEAAATLELRRGDPKAVDFYLANDRVRSGTQTAMIDEAFNAWAYDTRQGLTSLLVVGTNSEADSLNRRAQAARVALGLVRRPEAETTTGTTIGIGDHVVTRRNHRRLLAGPKGDFVKNGDTWEVTGTSASGELTVRNLRNRSSVRLPNAYALAHIELAYASTVHRVQGMTADTAHVLVADTTSRESVYVAATRSRQRTHLYEVSEPSTEIDPERPPNRNTSKALGGLLRMARPASQPSALELTRCQRNPGETRTWLVGLTGAPGAVTAQPLWPPFNVPMG